MTIPSTAEAEARIRQLVDSGRYGDPTIVVDEALRVLEEWDHLDRLSASLAVGVDQYARGRVVTWTPDLLERLRREADEEDRRGIPIKDDIKP